MEHKTVSGITLPAIGFGTWMLGGEREADYSADEQAIAIIKEAIRLGCTHIDTAELYGNGHCEELVGKAIADFDRKNIFITTKVRWENLAYEAVLEAAKKSLKRLQTPYIDMYMIHAFNPQVPLAETMRAMNELVEQGLVRHIAVSNFSVAQMQEAQKHSKHKIVANQIEYSLITRNLGTKRTWDQNKNMEQETVPYCQAHGIFVISERPIERGKLAREGYPVLDALAKKYDKTQAQIALNWLISKKNVLVIPKSSTSKQLHENVGATGWHLSAEDMLLLDETTFPTT